MTTDSTNLDEDRTLGSHSEALVGEEDDMIHEHTDLRQADQQQEDWRGSAAVLLQVAQLHISLLVLRQRNTDRCLVDAGPGTIAVSPHPPHHLPRHDDQLRQGEATIQVGLCPGEEEPGEVSSQLVSDV